MTDLDWIEKMGVKNAMEYLEKNNMVLVAPGANYSTPAEDANITTVRSQCKSTLIDHSWRMIFASESEFDTLLTQLQHTLHGLGYEKVYAVDLKNAKDQTDARREVVDEGD